MNMRLDIAVLSKVADANRSRAQKLIRSGNVAVNGIVAKLPGKKVSLEDKIEVSELLQEEKNTQSFDVKVIYEDKDVIALDKPAGMLTHSKGEELREQTVASWLAEYLGQKPKTNRDFIVHRLDRGTSGVIICAKNEQAQKLLQKQFSSRKVNKKYLAIVSGMPKPEEAIIDAPIERNPKQPSRFRTGENGKPATTRYRIEQVSPSGKISLVSLYPKTGRTHQIRVHMSYIGHPILGDQFYDGKPAGRMLLHAAELQLKLPNGETKKFESKTPEEFKKVTEQE